MNKEDLTFDYLPQKKRSSFISTSKNTDIGLLGNYENSFSKTDLSSEVSAIGSVLSSPLANARLPLGSTTADFVGGE